MFINHKQPFVIQHEHENIQLIFHGVRGYFTYERTTRNTFLHQCLKATDAAAALRVVETAP